jgi:2-polyprenyl-3-methyl-5-hydroxy-6-metoxy-1,4-benzoquinol methylase
MPSQEGFPLPRVGYSREQKTEVRSTVGGSTTVVVTGASADVGRPTAPSVHFVSAVHREGPEDELRSAVPCAVCGSQETVVLRRSEEIARDLASASRGLDRAVHNTAADVFTCRSCASVFRDPDTIPSDLEVRYRDATFAPQALEHLRARRRADLEHDETWLQAHGARPSARVLEIGSYVGAFLDFALAHGCRATGYDLGRQMAEYCRRRGLRVTTGAFRAADGAHPIYDAVFVLNCFEQVANPSALLRDVGRVLRPGGELVIRTPNAAFVRLVHAGNRPRLRSVADGNAVLGVPFARCFSVRALHEVLSAAEFEIGELRGHEFTWLVPAGHSRIWRWMRPIRRGALALASAVRHEPLDPWLDVTARARS